MHMIQSVTPEYSWFEYFKIPCLKWKTLLFPYGQLVNSPYSEMSVLCIMVEYGSNLSSSVKNTTHEDFLGSQCTSKQGMRVQSLLDGGLSGQGEKKKKNLAKHVSEMSEALSVMKKNHK